MSGRPTDDELRAMLEARAGAVSPGAAREALAGARAAIAGPTRHDGAGVAFLPRPVASVRRRSRTPWGIAAVAAAAVVAVAVLGSRVQPDRPTASAPAVVAGTTETPTSSGPSIARDDITVDELRSQLSAGALDGKTVVVPGRLFLVQGRCRAMDCTFVKLDGLPDVFIGKGDRTTEATQAAIDRFGQSAPVVLRAQDSQLELVGWLVAGADAPLQADALPDFRDRVTDGLVAAMGWVHSDAPRIGHAGGIKRLSTSSDPEHGHWASVSVQVPLWDAGDTAPVEGRFLLRPAAADSIRLGLPTAWDLVARFDPESTVWVQQPRTDLAGPTIPAADLMTALGDGSLDGQLFAIDGELKSVAWDCPSEVRPCLRFYVDGLPGVAVTWSGTLQGSDGSPGAPTSIMEGRLMVTPRNGYLQLLGRLDGDLDRPIGLGELPATVGTPMPDPLGLRAVNGWLVVGGPIYCAMMRPGTGGCPPAYSALTPFEPSPSGDPTSSLSVSVAVHRGAPGVDALPIRQAGPFLVRDDAARCDSSEYVEALCGGDASRIGWIVEGAYDPGSVRVVTFP